MTDEGGAAGRDADFYAVLGVDRDASGETIREAYRERAKETHPDVADATDAADQFRRVKRAHEVLGDPAERSRYDRLGHEAYVANASDSEPDTGGRGEGGRERQRTTGTASERRNAGGNASAAGSGAWSSSSSSTGASANADATAGDRTYADGGAGTRATGATAGARRAHAGNTRPGYGTASADERVQREEVGSVRWGVARWVRFAARLLDAWQSRLTAASGPLALAVFVAYPVFLGSTVSPWFPTSVNLLVGVCTIFTIAYLVLRPEIGIPVFGGWLLFLPVALSVAGLGVFSLAGLLAFTLTFVPFALCVGALVGGATL